MFFSIVTVVLNARFDIEKTMNSIREQSFYDYEYLIIDGGSTDGTLEYVKSKVTTIRIIMINFMYFFTLLFFILTP